MDNILGSYNNGDIYVNRFEVLEISSVQIQHQFICEGRSNSVIFHEEDVDPAVDWDYNNDKTTSNDNKYQGKFKGNNHDEDLYHLCVEKLKHKWKQNTTDAFTAHGHVIRKTIWKDYKDTETKQYFLFQI